MPVSDGRRARRCTPITRRPICASCGRCARAPDALIVLWATDLADGEIAAEEGKVVAAMRAAGDRRIVFVPVTGLAFGGCNAHPSLADQRIIADRIGAAIAANLPGWR